MGDKIVVIGSVNMDLSVKVKDMPLVGETIIGKSISYIPGGKGANQSGAIGKLGGDVVFLASIGDDAFGKVQIETLSSYKVDCTKFKINKGCSTGTAIIYVNDKGDNNIVVIPEANALLDKTYIDDNISFLEDSSYVLLQMEIPYDTVAYALKEAKKRDNIVILNPAPAGDIDEDLFSYIDYITPNETELMKLSGFSCVTKQEVVEAAKSLLAKGVKNVLVTLGESGCVLVNKENTKFFEAKRVKAIDTTAAGDCFNGAFVTALSKGLDIDEAINFAIKAASISVTKLGAMSSLPTLEEVENL